MLKLLTTFNKFCLLLFCCLPIAGIAKQSDQTAPLQIWADTFIADKKNNRASYTGNVKFEQGSIKINCHRLDIIYLSDQADKIDYISMQASDAETDVANFEQINDENVLIKASAKNIKYDQAGNLITFTGNAELQEGNNLFKAESMLFNTAESRLITNQTQDSKDSSEKNRVFISIQPDKQ